VTPSPITPSAVSDALLSVGVTPGSVVLVHADAIVAAQFPPAADFHSSSQTDSNSNDWRLDLLIEAVEAVIGARGTLVMPAFSYSFTKGEAFDVRRTPSAVGMVSERFRIRPRVRRTSDPIFSFAGKGPAMQELCAVPVNGCQCFGANSVLSVLHRLNAHIIELGCSMTRGGTFVHYVETAHGVDYRYRKEFSGTIISESGETAECSVIYNVRDLTRKSEADLRRLQKRLSDEGVLRTAHVGRSRIMGVTAKNVFETAWKMLDEDPVSLIAEGVCR